MPPKSKKPAPAGQPAQPPPGLDDIDLAAALPPAPPPTETTETKRGRGRPRSTAPKPPPPPRKYKVRKDKGIKRKPTAPAPTEAPIYINIGDSSIDYNKDDNSAVTNLKEKLTVKELKFLEIYFQGNITQVNALKSAGYEGYSEDYYSILARKIILKYESRAGDHRIIFRAMGAGEVAVVQGLLKLAQGSKSEMVRLNAWSMIAKCIGLTKEQVEGAGGITIIFDSPERPMQARELPSAGEEPEPITYQQPVKVLQITK